MVTGINRSRPYVNIALAAVNVLVFLYLEAIGSTEDGVFMVKHGLYLRLLLSLVESITGCLLPCSCTLESAIWQIICWCFWCLERRWKGAGSYQVFDILPCQRCCCQQYIPGCPGTDRAGQCVRGGFRRNLRCGRRSGLCDCHSSWSAGRTNQQAAGLYGSADALSWVYFSRSGQYGSHRGPDFRLHIRYPALQEKRCCQNFRYGWIECRLC